MSWIKTNNTGLQLHCTYCDHDGIFLHFGSFIYTEEKYSLYRCPQCQSLIYHPRPVPARREADMAPATLEDYRTRTRYYLETGYSIDHIVRCAMATLAAVPPSERARHLFVDIGAGIGLSSVFVRRHAGMETLTVEPSPSAHVGTELFGLRIHQAVVEDLPAEVLAELRDRPSVLHLNSVVEHVAHPVAALRAIMGLTHVEALAIVVPDGTAIDKGMPFLTQLGLLVPGDHMHLPTPEGLRHFFTRLGLPEVRVAQEAGLIVATGARRPFSLPAPDQVTAACDDFLEALSHHPNRMVAEGALTRRMPYAAQRGDYAQVEALHARLSAPLPDPATVLGRLRLASDWQDIPFHVGAAAFWIAHNAFRRGRPREGEDWCDVLEAFAERQASDQPLYAATTLYFRTEGRLWRAHALAAHGHERAAMDWLDRVIASAADHAGGADEHQVRRAREQRTQLAAISAPADPAPSPVA